MIIKFSFKNGFVIPAIEKKRTQIPIAVLLKSARDCERFLENLVLDFEDPVSG